MDDGTPAARHRVLIVDDEVTIRVALRRFFLRLGWDVEEAATGERALDLLSVRNDETPHALPYSLVVSDLRMPGVNGIEMYDRLKQSHPEVLDRLIFSTGDIVSEDAATFVRETECPVLQKPFELAVLRAHIDRMVSLDHP